MTVVQGKWGATNVQQVFRDCLYESDQVYLDLKAGGAGISLSLVKMVDFFASKVGTNAAAEASSSSKPPRLSSRAVAKAYMLYILGAFLFPTKKGTDVSPKYLNFFESKNSYIIWSWGVATLAHLYYSLGASSRVNAKALACCTTLLEVVWDPYLEKRTERHLFKKVVSFTRNPICLEGNGLRFAIQLCAYKPKYEWEDLFFGGKWKDSLITTRGRKVHDRIPACVEGFFEWFKGVSITKLFPTAANLDKNDDGRILGDGDDGGGGGVESPVGGGGVGSPVQGQNEDIICRLEEEISNLKLEKETDECERLKESNDNLQADLQVKQVVNSIWEKDFSKTEKKLNDKLDECESLASINEKLMDEVANLQPQPLAVKVNVVRAEDWKQKYDEIAVKYEEVQRKLSERDMNEMWYTALKCAIEKRKGDFRDPEDPTWERLGRQFTKLLAIAQEGSKGEYQDDLTLEGGGGV
ncbi:hypothetical protein GIB67_025150 [Kingdonia uniflora]|uniref:Aminotransferase-like plant mobile domain-containing protein n=1 Tax=Kingdonia uniflora TaxID=39325 RepID=A0A7J7N826_9MAGN|nr:hypothetical protein GIB67_025150 [Kingdonia uniflora]